jgi:hypothetical protein
MLVFDYLEFAESHKGPISNHKFNEAINGVFRSEKQQCEKKQKSKPVEQQQKLDKGQKTIDKSIAKKNNQQSGRQTIGKSKNSHGSASSQSDEHF